MKRRDFIRSLSVGFAAAVVNPTFVFSQPVTGYEAFIASMHKQIAISVGLPIEIINMTFSKGYSLSQEMLLIESQYLNIQKGD